jgi:glycine hydroxymethyltransferase
MILTSGLRISTGVATRGFMAEECRALAVWICDVLDHLGNADVEAQVARQAAQLCARPFLQLSARDTGRCA